MGYVWAAMHCWIKLQFRTFRCVWSSYSYPLCFSKDKKHFTSPFLNWQDVSYFLFEPWRKTHPFLSSEENLLAMQTFEQTWSISRMASVKRVYHHSVTTDLNNLHLQWRERRMARFAERLMETNVSVWLSEWCAVFIFISGAAEIVFSITTSATHKYNFMDIY